MPRLIFGRGGAGASRTMFLLANCGFLCLARFRPKRTHVRCCQQSSETVGNYTRTRLTLSNHTHPAMKPNTAVFSITTLNLHRPPCCPG